MARISYQLLPEEYKEYFLKNLSPNWRFTMPRIMRTERFVSRAKKKALSEQSFFQEIGILWKSLSDSEREAWGEAGGVMGLSGWRLFIQEMTIRLKRGIEGIPSPSLLHQSWVGCLNIQSPATEIKLVQPHPEFYWLPRTLPGQYPLLELVWLREDFSLPLKIGLSYKTNLQSISENSFARFFARVWHSYQGQDLYTEQNINLPLSSSWSREEKTLQEVAGYIISYELFFELSGVEGELFFDNVLAEHSGYNWARDSACKKIDENFVRGFFQVLTPWLPISLPVGASYFSDYIED